LNINSVINICYPILLYNYLVRCLLKTTLQCLWTYVDNWKLCCLFQETALFAALLYSSVHLQAASRVAHVFLSRHNYTRRRCGKGCLSQGLIRLGHATLRGNKTYTLNLGEIFCCTGRINDWLIVFRAVFWVFLPCKMIFHGRTTQKTAMNITLAAVRTWNLTDWLILRFVKDGLYVIVRCLALT
jgi:hypothetical protein